MLSYLDGEHLVHRNTVTYEETMVRVGPNPTRLSDSTAVCVIDNGSIYVREDSTKEIGNMRAGSRVVSFSPDDREFIVVDDTIDDITQIRSAQTNSVIAEFYGLNSSNGAFSPNGDYIVFVGYTGVAVVDRTSLNVRVLFEDSVTANVQFNETGFTVLVMKLNEDVVTSAVHSVNPVTMTSEALTPDSMTTSYCVLPDGRICTVDLVNVNSTETRVRIHRDGVWELLEDVYDAESVICTGENVVVIRRSPGLIVYDLEFCPVVFLRTRSTPSQIRIEKLSN
jgi:hypothetical protein